LKVFIDATLYIYLNTLSDSRIRRVYERYYIDLLLKNKVYTDVLVLDEIIYISKKKYNIPYSLTLDFIQSHITPYTNIIPLGEDEYEIASKIINKYNIKPSDALHIGAMKNNNINVIITEDKEFDKINDIERVWL